MRAVFAASTFVRASCSFWLSASIAASDARLCCNSTMLTPSATRRSTAIPANILLDFGSENPHRSMPVIDGFGRDGLGIDIVWIFFVAPRDTSFIAGHTHVFIARHIYEEIDPSNNTAWARPERFMMSGLRGPD